MTTTVAISREADDKLEEIQNEANYDPTKKAILERMISRKYEEMKR